MSNTDNNSIINIFKDKRYDFFDDYYTEHSLEELIGGRVVNNILQLRQSLASIFFVDTNLKLISKLDSKIKKIGTENQMSQYRFYLIVDLFVFNIKNKEEHEKYWCEFIKKYNAKKSKKKGFQFPSIYIGLGRDKKSSYGITVESDLGFTQKDFKNFKIEGIDSFTPIDSISIEGTKSFFRVYAIFDTKDKKAKKEMEKYYNLDYGLDKFEKKVF